MRRALVGITKRGLGAFRFISVGDIEDPAVAEIATQVLVAGAPLPLGKVVTSVSPKSKDRIFKSGKGVEGFVKAASPILEIIVSNGIKMVSTSATANGQVLEEAVSAAKPVNALASNAALRIPEAERNFLDRLITDKCVTSYKPLNEIYQLSRIKASYEDVVHYVMSCGKYWYSQHQVRVRQPGESTPPPQEAGLNAASSTSRAAATPTPTPSQPTPVRDSFIGFRKVTPQASNNFGGWGSMSGVPTEEDVYEILKFIPIHWGNLGGLNITPAIKKKHIRVSSILQWLRRQPKFFEVRNIAGTLEVRRAITLHPEHHGKTFEEAEQWLKERILSGEHNSVNTANTMGVTSLAAVAVHKFLVRVAPGYFVAPELLFMRYSKKGLNPKDLVTAAREYPTTFELLECSDGSFLMRRRTGADSSKWRADFEKDLESRPEDLKGLVALMGRCSCLWDRPQYLYVRLLESEQILVGGFEGMMELMKRHPMIFRVGENYFKRVNLSDPSTIDQPEPTGFEETCPHEEENVYVGHRDLATIFHYVSPDDSTINAAQLVECASPAMKPCIPPRVITILQMFPDLFNCKETTPGTFTIRKVRQQQRGSAIADDDMGSDECDLSADEVVDAIKGMIPAKGVEIATLESWLPMDVKTAVEVHFSSVADLAKSQQRYFALDSHGVVSLR